MVQQSKKLFVSQPNVAQALYQCVAETAVTTMMAQNFHWNVTGMLLGRCMRFFRKFMRITSLLKMI